MRDYCMTEEIHALTGLPRGQETTWIEIEKRIKLLNQQTPDDQIKYHLRKSKHPTAGMIPFDIQVEYSSLSDDWKAYIKRAQFLLDHRRRRLSTDRNPTGLRSIKHRQKRQA